MKYADPAYIYCKHYRHVALIEESLVHEFLGTKKRAEIEEWRDLINNEYGFEAIVVINGVYNDALAFAKLMASRESKPQYLIYCEY